MYKSTLPQWRRLLESDLRFLVYTGDQDGILPHLGTRLWIDGLQLPIRQKWRAWHSSTGQTCVYSVLDCIAAGLPHLGTRLWIGSLQLPIQQKGRAWHSSQQLSHLLDDKDAYCW